MAAALAEVISNTLQVSRVQKHGRCVCVCVFGVNITRAWKKIGEATAELVKICE